MTDLHELDKILVGAASKVRLLSSINYPVDEVVQLIDDRRKGVRRLPSPPKPTPVPSSVVDALETVERKADLGDPVGIYLARTARSYRRVAELIGASGTPEFHRISRFIYGGPDSTLAGAQLTHVQAATNLMETSAALRVPVTAPQMDAKAAAKWVRKRIDGAFEHPLKVRVGDLNALASASSKRIRLRRGAMFTEHKLRQLVEHEVFIHTLTARNGKRQPLKAFGLGAARTTATQEGLATFAELASGCIDLNRLWRIALRIRAVAWAEEGADFVQLVDKISDLGEDPAVAVQTAVRVFRGGDPNGRYVFTKDTVYLKGLFAVHTFMRKAVEQRKLEWIRRLFAGRITLGDITELETRFDDGFLEPPRFVPDWAANPGTLAGFLAVSMLIDHVELREVTLEEIEDVVSPG